MKTATNCVVNAIHVINVSVVKPLTGPEQDLKAEYALVHRKIDKSNNTTTNTTHGKVTAGPLAWSKETRERLTALLDSMEQDLISRHFEGDGEGVEEDARDFIGGHEAPTQV